MRNHYRLSTELVLRLWYCERFKTVKLYQVFSTFLMISQVLPNLCFYVGFFLFPAKPGMFDMTGKAKWEAWNGLKGENSLKIWFHLTGCALGFK